MAIKFVEYVPVYKFQVKLPVYFPRELNKLKRT